MSPTLLRHFGSARIALRRGCKRAACFVDIVKWAMRGFPAPVCVESGFACPVSPEIKSTVSASLLVNSRVSRGGSLAALALGCLLLLSNGASAQQSHELIGKPAPDLVARGLTGENVRISEHRGEVVVVSFWSGSCNTCRAQLSALDRIAKTYASAGLTVIGVNVDDDVARAEKFARSSDVQFPLLISTPENTGRDYDVDRVPMLVLVDRSGVLRAAHREFKARDEATYVRELRALLNE